MHAINRTMLTIEYKKNSLLYFISLYFINVYKKPITITAWQPLIHKFPNVCQTGKSMIPTPTPLDMSASIELEDTRSLKIVSVIFVNISTAE
ncbi:MAG: hypothetical protein AMQ22_01808 [Candidatus Methanofastidiosum methylothiophilum]|uniref:Uncharacterized protein n=1 Tax=Candidatus Methanofastidiosum methylothiophilum TaxID=1705564 RepID=A0A150IVI0_9EURY|nr:MAG: hypothetical protein AMQ22_01808 [Candidatus Methanofastidiosum methylthiophilus]